ncbi:HAMP domain-containing histidine kinase [bacterium]|nr:HAMP domain-containing histidine kinase [bacterium]
MVLLTPPPSADFVALCLQRDAYRAAAQLAPISPSPCRIYWRSKPGEIPVGAHAATAQLPYHQVGLIESYPPRYYGVRVPLDKGGEVWAEARLSQGYYQMSSSWASTFRWYFGLSIFYLLLLGSSSLLLRRIRARLQSVSQAARQLASGDLTTVCSGDERDPSEVALLVARLNEMGAALRSRHQQLGQRRQELEEASRERNRRLAEVSHDLRTPLTSILGYAQLYHDQGFASLAVVEAEGKALLTRVGRWLESCRLESGVLEMRLGEVHLHDILEEAFHLAQQWHALEASVDLPDKSPVIVADPILLPRILARLLVHLSRSQIHLTLRSRQLIVTGSGTGLGEADPALVSLETCRQLLLRQHISLQLTAERIQLDWESPWSD